MGILVSEMFDNVRQQIAKENGYISYSDFNRMSKRAELRVLDYITGNIKGDTLPQAYTTQKDKDWIAPLITKFKTTLNADGEIVKPDNYYEYENMYALSLENVSCEGETDDNECGEMSDEEFNKVVKTAVELLDGQAFNIRAKTFIKGLKPSVSKPIAKEISNVFELLPSELPGVVLEYIRFPKYAFAVTKIDPVYNDEVIDEAASTNYEWSEQVSELLIWIIVDLFSNSVRENALKSFNAATSPIPKP